MASKHRPPPTRCSREGGEGGAALNGLVPCRTSRLVANAAAEGLLGGRNLDEEKEQGARG